MSRTFDLTYSIVFRFKLLILYYLQMFHVKQFTQLSTQ